MFVIILEGRWLWRSPVSMANMVKNCVWYYIQQNTRFFSFTNTFIFGTQYVVSFDDSHFERLDPKDCPPLGHNSHRSYHWEFLSLFLNAVSVNFTNIEKSFCYCSWMQFLLILQILKRELLFMNAVFVNCTNIKKVRRIVFLVVHPTQISGSAFEIPCLDHNAELLLVSMTQSVFVDRFECLWYTLCQFQSHLEIEVSLSVLFLIFSHSLMLVALPNSDTWNLNAYTVMSYDVSTCKVAL